MKLVEKMAEAMEQVSFVGNAIPREQLPINMNKRLAQAALGALPIIVLEKDTAPQVGDLYYVDEDGATLPIDKELITAWEHRPKGRIVLRDNIAVIYEEE